MSDRRVRGLRGATSDPRVHPSRAEASSIARPRLLEYSRLARERRCMVLQGPAGCGKTTVLGLWRRALVAAGTDVAWVALDAADDEARFFDTLFVALSAVDPAMTRDARMMASRSDQPGRIEGIVIALVRGIAARPHHVALVFDDAHRLRDTRILEALQLLLDYAPANLSCIFASRIRLPFSVARLRDRGELLEIGPDTLRFTVEESVRLAGSLLDDVDHRQALALHELTEGWVAGLKLLCLDLRRRGNPDKPLGGWMREAQIFARYFERETLSRLSSDELRFVVLCALPEHFNTALCNALQGDRSPMPSPELLTRLEGQGLLLIAAGPRYPEGWWRLHPLLRDVLLERIDVLPEAERRRLHTLAWKWFAEHDMPHDAFHHALQAGETTAAAQLGESCASALFAQGDLRRLARIVRQLPDSIVQDHLDLRLWMAWTQLYERRLSDCARSIAQLQRDMVDATPAMRQRFLLLRGLYAVHRDDTAAAMAILPELQAMPASADVITLTGQRNLLTWTHLYRGDYERARLVQLEEVSRESGGPPLYGTFFGALAGRCLVGLTHAVEGQMIQAERIYRDVLYEADRRGAHCVDASCMAAGLLGEVLYELNDPTGAIELLEQHLDILEHVSTPDTVLRVMLVIGRSRWLIDRPLDALAYVGQIHDYAERMGLDRLRAYCLLERVRFDLQRNALSDIPELMAALDGLDARHARLDTGTLSEIRVVAERARIRLAMHSGDLDAARRRLHALEALCRQRGRARRIPYLRMQLAAVERQLGHEGAAYAHVHEALRYGHRLGLLRTLLDAHAQAPALVREGAASIRDDLVLSFYAERLEAASRTRFPGKHVDAGGQQEAAWARAMQALTPRETEIVQLLLQAMPNKKIARVLDLSLDTVKWHLKNCYGKLGVSGRDEVVERMREAGHH